MIMPAHVTASTDAGGVGAQMTNTCRRTSSVSGTALLDRLSPKTAELVARNNVRNLLERMAERRRLASLSKNDMAGIALPADYRFPEYAHMPRLRDDESFVRSRLTRLADEESQD